jgi:hypothetical protein
MPPSLFGCSSVVGVDYLPAQSNLSQARLYVHVKSVYIPILVAVAVCKYKIRQFLHDRQGCGVHEIQRIPVIWLDEFVFRRESGPSH